MTQPPDTRSGPLRRAETTLSLLIKAQTAITHILQEQKALRLALRRELREHLTAAHRGLGKAADDLGPVVESLRRSRIA